MRYKAISCSKASHIAPPPRPYGYTIHCDPPETFTTTGKDIEGIGWWPHPPQLHTIRFKGWYKYKADAEKRAQVYNDAKARGEA